MDIVESKLTNDNIIIFNWSSSINYAMIIDNETIVNHFNLRDINRQNKKYILLVGDTDITNNIRIPQYKFEYYENVIFNFIDK